jgi:hypothetical protein
LSLRSAEVNLDLFRILFFAIIFILHAQRFWPKRENPILFRRCVCLFHLARKSPSQIQVEKIQSQVKVKEKSSQIQGKVRKSQVEKKSSQIQEKGKKSQEKGEKVKSKKSQGKRESMPSPLGTCFFFSINSFGIDSGSVFCCVCSRERRGLTLCKKSKVLPR